MKTRRDFLKEGALLAAATAAGAQRTMAQEEKVKTSSGVEMPPTTRRGDMVYRQLGSTGQEVSLIGSGWRAHRQAKR